MVGLIYSRFGDGTEYNVASTINAVAGLPDQIADAETRIDALEEKQQILGQYNSGQVYCPSTIVFQI